MVEAKTIRLSSRSLAAVLALTFLALLTVTVGSASAQPEGARIKSFTAVPSGSQAGSHPDLNIDFEVGSRSDPFIPNSCFCNDIETAKVETPAGFFGNPHAVAECTTELFVTDHCPTDSQVGVALPEVLLTDVCCAITSWTPVYNLVPKPGQAGLLGFKGYIYSFPIYTVIHARTGGDFGLNAEVNGITRYFGLVRFHQVLWGVPASPIHDDMRFAKGGFIPMGTPTPSNLPEKPFFTMPTTCQGPLTSKLVSIAYDGGVHVGEAPWPATTGCDQIGFNPSLSASPSTSQSDSPSGLDVTLKVPQKESPVTPTDSSIRAIKTTLPKGFSINPSTADGKTSCSDEQAHVLQYSSEEEAECPEFSKVGTFTLDSWTLPTPIEGGIYLGEPKPGNRYRLITTADGYGTHIKLQGSVHVDPQTGQMTTVFTDLPQAPYTRFDQHYFGSERGLLATPERCGTYAVESEFEPWAGNLPNQTSTQFFKIDSGPGGKPCPGEKRPFSPGFRAVGETNGAGAHDPFSILITRDDGDQNLDTITVKTPPGFTASLKGVPYCPDATLAEIASSSRTGLAEQASSLCPAGSQIGTSSAGAGAGSRPYYVDGKVYLAGPYKGAPLSLAVVTPATSGPYDLGNVVNRVALRIDPVTAQVTAVSDPLPQVIEGIPLRVRSVLINLNRQRFSLNPTSCKPFDVQGLLVGNEGTSATGSTHFQMANCDALDFSPKLTTTLRGSTKRTGYPALKAVLTQDPGESNIGRAVVSLPHSEFLEQAHIGTICTRVQFAAKACPAASVYGRARVVTPILDDPLEGPVYLRSSSHNLPDLVAALKGPARQPIEIELSGRIDTDRAGGIRTTFAAVPDAPVSKFVLEMKGGKKGLLVNSENLCSRKRFLNAKMIGQNEARKTLRPLLKAPCGGKAKRAKRGAKGGKR
ncbi:MAG TPA: hypothetical protein VFJ61_04165 [Solirubrobacterales bacterium]|nr:hypothetical protein [Solirubrobacterales bacterium]